jgi:hypothetical protein
MSTFADHVLAFLEGLDFSGSLPEGISILNPYSGENNVMPVVSSFYNKYYNDSNPRYLILGINPGRFGAGVTGIPFTDTIRLEKYSGLSFPGPKTYETSSVFVYEMIERYGGSEKFFGDFFIGAVSPLGFTCKGKNGRIKNFNYYDSPYLMQAVSGFISESLRKQLELGIKRDVCFCMGSGKNFRYLSRVNENFGYFGRIEPLDHPRFIMQYRAKQKDQYIEHYLRKFSELMS